MLAINLNKRIFADQALITESEQRVRSANAEGVRSQTRDVVKERTRPAQIQCEAKAAFCGNAIVKLLVNAGA
jgi:hypothetical protein